MITYSMFTIISCSALEISLSQMIYLLVLFKAGNKNAFSRTSILCCFYFVLPHLMAFGECFLQPKMSKKFCGSIISPPKTRHAKTRSPCRRHGVNFLELKKHSITHLRWFFNERRKFEAHSLKFTLISLIVLLSSCAS